ncbi:hypothetical protein NY406_06550 [Chlorobaculum sp. MV4-Y]|uniref:hypothetical protein n=1 Tax=Chlorobaculum sp. MV4-Y TaxID=2976335 RepID=UPI0021AE8E31|nr:hypothetical protein [Chlorobaculum sp. MV4-Y]UWX56909.1 hypothetical protein NY406_06550 [Chlorobaculum sp. MV4-Y]
MISLLVLFTSFHGSAAAISWSPGPRQTGEVLLDEAVTGLGGFVIRVGSNGCTSKNSFDVLVKKKAGITSLAPHYELTIVRKTPDECKAIVEDGVVIAYDLKNDLGISGNYTYSITNPVSSAHPFADVSGYYLPKIVKDAAMDVPLPREVRPEPFEQFTARPDFFSCLLPVDWARSAADPEGDAKAGIYQVQLTRDGLARPEDGEKYYFPRPLIYVGYYAPGNREGKTYANYLADYDRLLRKNAGSNKSCYNKPRKMTIAGREATVTDYEVWQELPRGPLFTTKYWLKARFVVVKARQGFYVLAFKSPKEFYNQNFPTFQTVLDSFAPKR